MQRLIDADALEQKSYRIGDMRRSWCVVDLKDIKNAPTVDAVPAEWIKAKIESLKSQGNEFASLSARIIQAMLNDYGADGERR